MPLAMSRALISAAALTAATLVAACGGSANSGQGASSPSAAVKSYLTAIAHGDGAGACAVLSPALQKRAVSIARSQGIKASSCADLFGRVKAHLSPAQLRTFQNAKVSSASHTGTNATVTINGASSQPTLAESGGKWVITGGIGF